MPDLRVTPPVTNDEPTSGSLTSAVRVSAPSLSYVVVVLETVSVVAVGALSTVRDEGVELEPTNSPDAPEKTAIVE